MGAEAMKNRLQFRFFNDGFLELLGKKWEGGKPDSVVSHHSSTAVS